MKRTTTLCCLIFASNLKHDDVIKWKDFPRYWPFVPRIHWSLMNFLHKEQWCRALMFSLICVWVNGWVNNREAGDLRCHRVHHDVTVMVKLVSSYSTAFILHHCYHTEGLVQERCNSSALSMELHLSCTNPSIWTMIDWGRRFIVADFFIDELLPT